MSHLTKAEHRDYFVDERFFSYPKAVNFLLEMGINLYPISLDSRLYEGISGHSDIIGCPIFFNTIIDKTIYQRHEKNWNKFRIMLGDSTLEKQYPKDIWYNVAVLGKVAIHSKYIDPIVKQTLEKYKIESIVVKQGYAKCSIVVVDENSIITSDVGIYQTCRSRLDVCFVQSWEDIFLWGMEYGFLGGTCLTRGNKIYFTGDISKHPDYLKMKSFSNKRGIELVSMREGKLIDVGGFLPVYLKDRNKELTLEEGTRK